MVTVNFVPLNPYLWEKKWKLLYALCNTVSLPTRYTCQNFPGFAIEEGVGKFTTFCNSFFSPWGSGGIGRNQFFSTHPTDSAFLCFCLFVVVLKSSPWNMLIYSDGGGWGREKHCLPFVPPPESNPQLSGSWGAAPNTEPPGLGCLSCDLVSPPFLLLSEANTEFLKFRFLISLCTC